MSLKLDFKAEVLSTDFFFFFSECFMVSKIHSYRLFLVSLYTGLIDLFRVYFADS